MTVGAILQIASYSVAQMITGRIIAGIGNGINTAVSYFFAQSVLWGSNHDLTTEEIHELHSTAESVLIICNRLHQFGKQKHRH